MSILHPEVTAHYALLVGVKEPWVIESGELLWDKKKIHLRLAWPVGAHGPCPKCGRACPAYDHGPNRIWRHLDSMQCQTELHARVPRMHCPEHGILTLEVPWAAPGARFTLHFERFALEVLQVAATVQAACDFLGVGWATAQDIMRRGVERGLAARTTAVIPHPGMDEKSFKRAQSYITVLTDLDQGRVLEVVPDRTRAAADALWRTFTSAQLAEVVAVGMDMWAPFAAAARVAVPWAFVVHDKFHISKYLNECVDLVRRQEQAVLLARGDDRLTGTRQLWLYNPENLPAEQVDRFAALRDQTLKTSRAWVVKELFTGFWEHTEVAAAGAFFKSWYFYATHSRLAPVIKVAKMLQRHLGGLLSYIEHRITNATGEGLNSKIQALKCAARGFRNFANYRVRILFFCGKLEIYPQ